MKTLIEKLLRQSLATLPEDLLPASLKSSGVEIERTRDAQHGDFASNIAMQLGKATRQNPRKLAQALLAGLPPHGVGTTVWSYDQGYHPIAWNGPGPQYGCWY